MTFAPDGHDAQIVDVHYDLHALRTKPSRSNFAQLVMLETRVSSGSSYAAVIISMAMFSRLDSRHACRLISPGRNRRFGPDTAEDVMAGHLLATYRHNSAKPSSIVVAEQ